jgi:hypothetical protein
MKIKYFLLMVFIFSVCSARANDKDYSICAVAGFHEGNNNRFLTDLAERVAAKNNLFGDEQCKTALKAGKEVGMKFFKPGMERTDADYVIIRQATHFSNMIYDSILSRVKF